MENSQKGLTFKYKHRRLTMTFDSNDKTYNALMSPYKVI